MTTATANRPMNLLAWGLVLGLSALWSGAYFFTGVAINEVPPLTLASLRVGLAVVALYVALALMGIAMPRRVSVWAQIACLGAAVSYVFAGIYGRRFAKMGMQPLQTAAGQLTCSTAILLPFALYFEQPWTLPGVSLETVGAVVCIAVLSTALAYYLYFRILDLAGPTNLLLVTFIIPPLAIGLGVVG
jgi:drug/metabolite transporter (DMT)-like permease